MEAFVGINTHCTQVFCTFGADLHAQSVSIKKVSGSELRRKFIKSTLLVVCVFFRIFVVDVGCVISYFFFHLFFLSLPAAAARTRAVGTRTRLLPIRSSAKGKDEKNGSNDLII